MASKIVGSIVATDKGSGLKTVFHVHKDGGTITFTKPDNPGWSHQCHVSNQKAPDGWCIEVNTINTPAFEEAEYFPL
jgi:hypothetical protein